MEQADIWTAQFPMLVADAQMMLARLHRDGEVRSGSEFRDPVAVGSNRDFSKPPRCRIDKIHERLAGRDLRLGLRTSQDPGFDLALSGAAGRFTGVNGLQVLSAGEGGEAKNDDPEGSLQDTAARKRGAGKQPPERMARYSGIIQERMRQMGW